MSSEWVSRVHRCMPCLLSRRYRCMPCLLSRRQDPAPPAVAVSFCPFHPPLCSATAVGKNPCYTGMYYHKVSSDMQVGAELTHTSGKDVGLAFGCMYKLDKDTTVKGKVRHAARRLRCHVHCRTASCAPSSHASLDTPRGVGPQVDADGMLYSSYKQKLSPLATMTLAAQIDTVNLSENKHKFGMVLNVTA